MGKVWDSGMICDFCCYSIDDTEWHLREGQNVYHMACSQMAIGTERTHKAQPMIISHGEERTCIECNRPINKGEHYTGVDNTLSTVDGIVKSFKGFKHDRCPVTKVTLGLCKLCSWLVYDDDEHMTFSDGGVQHKDCHKSFLIYGANTITMPSPRFVSEFEGFDA